MKLHQRRLSLRHRLRHRVARLLGVGRNCRRGFPAGVVERFADYLAAHPSTGAVQTLRAPYRFNCPPPVVAGDAVQAEFAAGASVELPAFRLVRLDGVHLRSQELLLLTPDRTAVFLDSARSRAHLEWHVVKDAWLRLPRRRQPGPGFLAFDPWARHYYYHWLVDTLCRALALDHVPPDVPVLVPAHPAPFMVRALELFGVPPARCLAFDDTDWELPTCWFAAKPYGWFFPSPVEVRQVVARLLASLRLPERTGPSLYISRARCRDRQLANEPEIRAALERRGFATYFPELHSVDEQVAAFRAAPVVVGSFGSGLTNIMFCRPGTTVVVLYDETYFDTCIWALGCGLDLRLFGLSHQPGAPLDRARLAACLDRAAAPPPGA